MATIIGRWRESHMPPTPPLSWADANGGVKGAVAVDATNRVVARIEPKENSYYLTVDGWIWNVAGDKGTARLNAILASDPDPREKWTSEKPVKLFTSLAAAKTEAEEIATMLWPK
ncbi:hypothetical protein [Rhodoferax sp. GW822-FHT02A01]|uniref:hypothetical protein n=1 Tax=Rhodoferax sp. GW822-FHT02A01 TaxID=3141537 RepID=UPI00315CACD5